jgi:hypothetical protein
MSDTDTLDFAALDAASLAERVNDVLAFMTTNKVDLPSLLACVTCDDRIGFANRRPSLARAQLYDSEALPDIVRACLHDSRPRSTLQSLVVDEAAKIFEQELSRFDQRMKHAKPTHENLSEFSFRDLCDWVGTDDGLPHLWHVLTGLATPPRVQKRKRAKDHSMVGKG